MANHTNHPRKRSLDDCFRTIIAYKRANGGASPTIRELGELWGIPSTSHVRRILMALQAQGRLYWDGSGARNIRIPGERWDWQPPQAGREIGENGMQAG